MRRTVQRAEGTTMDSTRAKGTGRKQRRRTAPLFVPMAVVIVVTLLASNMTAVRLTGSGPQPKIQLASYTAPIAPYHPSEFYGGGSPDEACAVCTAAGLLGEAGGQSVESGQDVNPATGDFTTSNTLFSIPAVDAPLSVNLTYDQIAAGQASTAGYFGYGWGSNFSPTVSYTGGVMTVNEVNGSQLYFITPTTSTYGDGCPTGDYQDFQKYTVSGSSEAFCAPSRVDAQVGEFPSVGAFELYRKGGQSINVFNWAGQLTGVGNLFNLNAVTYRYSVAPGSAISGTADSCPTGPGGDCVAEVDSAGRAVIGATSAATGLITEVLDPMGAEYNLSYNGNKVLTGVTNLDYSSATTSYGYSSSSVREMTSITDPNNQSPNKPTTIAYYSYGQVQTVTSPMGKVTTYTYTQTGCDSATGCLYSGSPPVPLAQTTTVTYPDGEDDADEYYGGVLQAASFGANTSFGGTGNIEWTFNTNFQSTPIDETLVSSVDNPTTGNPYTASIYTDPVGNVVAYVDPNGNTTTSMYNDTGGNNMDELCWTASPLVTSIPSTASCSSPPVGSTSYTYAADGDVMSETDPLGNKTRYGYYSYGLLCWVAPPTVSSGSTWCQNNGISPSGYAPTDSTAYVYDSQGDVTTAFPAWGDASAGQGITSKYNVDDQLLDYIPATGYGDGAPGSNPYETAYSYWGNGQVDTTTTPAVNGTPQVTTDTYDLSGNVIGSVDPTGATTTAYDYDGRSCWTFRSTTIYSTTPSCTTVPSGSTQTTSYLGDTSAPLAVIAPNGNTSHETTYSYGDPEYATSPTQVTDPMSLEPTYTAYDPFGNACVTGPVSIPASDGCSAVSGDTYNDYNLEGQLQETTDPRGESTQYTYSDAAFPTEATTVMNPLSKSTTNTYDTDGRLISSLDPNGNTTSTVYDRDGRPCIVAPMAVTGNTEFNNDWAQCSTPPTGIGVTQYNYDAANDRTSMVDNYGTSTAVTDNYAYNTPVGAVSSDGQLAAYSNDVGDAVSYQYDDAGDVTCITYPVASGSNCNNAASTSNTIVKRTYNSAGQMATVTDWLGNTTNFSAYNTLGELKTLAYPAATGESLNYTYDSGGNPLSATYSGSVYNGDVDTWTPNFDEQVGSSTSTLPGMTASPTDTYNSYGQVTQATSPGNSNPDAFTYNTDGSMKTDTLSGVTGITDTVNPGSEITKQVNSVGSTTTSFGYNQDGQRCWQGSSTSATACSSMPSGATSYSYNGFGQLCQSEVNSSSYSGSCPTTATTGQSTYTYDGNGDLSTEKVAGSGTNGGALSFTFDTVDGGSTPEDIDDGWNAYIYGPTLFGASTPIEEINQAGIVSFLATTPSGVQTYFSDATGSTAAQAEITYSSYGAPSLLYLDGGTGGFWYGWYFANPNFLFQGSYQQLSGGLDYLFNRFYDPNTGQFLTVDPDVGTTGQPYAFAEDDPLEYSDPTGLRIACPGGCTDSETAAIASAYGHPSPPAGSGSTPSTSGPPASGVSQAQQQTDTNIGNAWKAGAAIKNWQSKIAAAQSEFVAFGGGLYKGLACATATIWSIFCPGAAQQTPDVPDAERIASYVEFYESEEKAIASENAAIGDASFIDAAGDDAGETVYFFWEVVEATG